MNVNFSEQELLAIREMAIEKDLQPEKVVIQAVRLYQLYSKDMVKVTFPDLNKSAVAADMGETEDMEDDVNDPRTELRTEHPGSDLLTA